MYEQRMDSMKTKKCQDQSTYLQHTAQMVLAIYISKVI